MAFATDVAFGKPLDAGNVPDAANEVGEAAAALEFIDVGQLSLDDDAT